MALTDKAPIYIQIAESLADDIMAGRYPAESRMPSVREHAADCQVNANTILKAFELLERNGIIFNRRGLGYFVSADAVTLIREQRRRDFYSSELNYFFGRLRQLEVTPDDLADEYRKFINVHK
ncbi:MAG: GntR family transcriptional regulator [Muribaculaceae bacterium]|nr:GntR family transcriptional regulator [Muribaculaceae bacterium]